MRSKWRSAQWTRRQTYSGSKVLLPPIFLLFSYAKGFIDALSQRYYGSIFLTIIQPYPQIKLNKSFSVVPVPLHSFLMLLLVNWKNTQYWDRFQICIENLSFSEVPLCPNVKSSWRKISIRVMRPNVLSSLGCIYIPPTGEPMVMMVVGRSWWWMRARRVLCFEIHL